MAIQSSGCLNRRLNTGSNLTLARRSLSRYVLQKYNRNEHSLLLVAAHHTSLRDNPDSFCYPIQLVRGQAEIFGAELAEGKTYLFGLECKAAVYTWQGCTIEMSAPHISTMNPCTYHHHILLRPARHRAVRRRSTSRKRLR